ncbi:MAG: hypothetical protein LAO79_07720, partial [Acidobacteriia bacterium]|nr:hypothetical protein [Terriglobia bacterium]
MAVANWESPDLLKYGGFLIVAICSSGMRLSVPGITGTLSLTFLFVLFGIAELTASETVFLGALVTLAQCYWGRAERPRPAKVLFNVSQMTLAVAATAHVYHASAALGSLEPAIRMAAATCTLFFLNTAPVAVMM